LAPYFLDDAAIYHGTPVGLQLICRRFEEEKVLGLTKIVANALIQSERDESGVVTSRVNRVPGNAPGPDSIIDKEGIATPI
jgi:hypothetical protein